MDKITGKVICKSGEGGVSVLFTDEGNSYTVFVPHAGRAWGMLLSNPIVTKLSSTSLLKSEIEEGERRLADAQNTVLEETKRLDENKKKLQIAEGKK